MTTDQKTTINAATKLAKALELHPGVLDYIVSLDPHDFKRLENPVMRKLMSPRISLERIATITGTPINTLLEHIAKLSGVTVELSAVEVSSPLSPQIRPAWISSIDIQSVRTVNLLPLDELLEADPMPPVMLEVKKLQPGEVLLIRHKWEPQPFYDIWAKLPKLEWFAEQVRADEWHIWVRRT
jgi:Domain of unknown function (DUF1858)/Uncharacterized conserved protein (DUF2249)